MTNKKYFGLEEALEIVRAIDKNACFSEQSGKIRGNIRLDAPTKIKLLEKIFECKCESGWTEKSLGWVENGIREPDYTIWNYVFNPTRITNYTIILEERK